MFNLNLNILLKYFLNFFFNSTNNYIYLTKINLKLIIIIVKKIMQIINHKQIIKLN